MFLCCDDIRLLKVYCTYEASKLNIMHFLGKKVLSYLSWLPVDIQHLSAISKGYMNWIWTPA